MNHEFQRVAIVNRAEAAMRFIHAVREFNHEHGTTIRTIALFTDPDRLSLFVREADEAFNLGSAHVLNGNGQPKSRYVDYDSLAHALTITHADAVWPGWGFVAEHADFADLCREMGIVFIGPTAEAMRRVGDKVASKHLAEDAGVPVVPWSERPIETLMEAHRHADRLGYPVIMKATAGGGGRGIRQVFSPSEMPQAFESAQSEAFKGFGDPTVFLEQVVPGARHIEVQIIADNFGTIWAAGVRDCTTQRRHQKILEEAPSPALSFEQQEELCSAAVRLSKTAQYTNAGTVEFLYDPAKKRYWFLEMNTRLQVEHPVTECTTGLDLVKLQIHVARGGRLDGSPPRATGHAIEVRLNAEDPEAGFAPSPGTIQAFRIQTGPGVRIDTGVAEGSSIPAEFDSMIAKLIAYGRTRGEALSRLRRALRGSVIVIQNGASNKPFLLDLLSRPEIQQADFDTAWLDRLAANGEHTSKCYADVALIHAAIEVYEAHWAIERTQFYASALRGRPQVQNEIGSKVDLRHRGQNYSTWVCQTGPHRYRIEVSGKRVDAGLDRLGEFEYWLEVFGRHFHIVSSTQGNSSRIEVDGVVHKIERGDGEIVHAPSPAVVISIAVKPGDHVSIGQRLAILEAMKMEMSVVAPFSGRVRRVMTMANIQVDAGAPLLQIEAEVSTENPELGQRVQFGASAASEEPEATASLTCRRSLEELRQLMLGFDLEAKQSNQLLAAWTQSCPTDSDEIRQLEDEVLNIFVDICALFQRAPDVNHRASSEEPTTEAYLFDYLRMLDTNGEGLPPRFVEALRRALRHYGVFSLDRTVQLECSLVRIYKSHERIEQQIAPVLALLERRLHYLQIENTKGDESFRAMLDQMVSMTAGSMPAVSDLAREVRYRYFDQPLFDQARKAVYEKAEGHLAYMAANPHAPDQHERLRALVECPQPLVTLLSSRFATATPAAQAFMLEVITSRYYRIRDLTNFHSMVVGNTPWVMSEYDLEGRHIHLFATQTEYAQLDEAAQKTLSLLTDVPDEHDIVLDFYTWHSGPLGAADSIQAEIQHILNEAGFPRAIRRIVVAVCGPGRGEGVGGMLHFTYRPNGSGYLEEKLYRGLHPMMGKRLHLWRLTNFNIERLPSVEDVYLLHAVARDNPKDERLFACAEVRDVTPIRDEKDRVVGLPHLERMLMEALAAIRLFQSRRKPQARLYWNRVMLYVWPPLNLERDELRDIVRRLAPSTEGLGLELVVVRARIPNPATGELRDMVVRISTPAGSGILITFRPADKVLPIKPLEEYEQKVVRMRQRGMTYPYEIIRMLTPSPDNTRAEFPPGEFVEHDLDTDDHLVPVIRPYGKNKANIIVGVIRNFTNRYTEGMKRVILLGDPSKDLGAIAEPECRRIMAALDLAQKKHLPLEWFPISAGAKISMDSGVENMDWIAKVLRRLIEFTQAGGEVNLLVNGINVGAQPYWNAEATMLMHTRGILVMTPKAAMVLTGKRALEYSGSISAEDNFGIGGYDRIMGLNGQAQYWARDIDEACHILMRHYEHTYVAPGERFPRAAASRDPVERDVRDYPHSQNGEEGFAWVGDILSDEMNPGRKKSFDIRRVMMAVIDQDHAPLERWAGMRAAETAVVWDAHLGGNPVCLVGIESRPMLRFGFVPADGPDHWSAGTLFPQSSKKVARAINSASGNRPLVLLANLSGFDGSPESMRRLQLEYGAEIGRSVVNFKGPIVFCVISRYHGGAYVVFSRALNPQIEVAALEGTYASVIGGAPAAAVVFAGEVEARARKDPRLQSLNAAIASAEAGKKAALYAQWEELFKAVHSEKLGEMAAEFDRVHSVERALKVGALHRIIPPANLRPYLVDAVKRGIQRVQGIVPVAMEPANEEAA
jgi:acetyl/propionyl-CoA carboxylase alpha subunit/acetyl-CoA carboxylase carboxyltransferase component